MPLFSLVGLLALLLQPPTPDTLAGPAAVPPVAPAPVPLPPTDTSLVDLLSQGGWALIPIGLLSLLGVFVLVERALALRRASVDPYVLLRTVRDHIQAGDLAGALRFTRAQDTPAGRVVQAGLERVGRPLGEIREAVQAAGRQEAHGLDRRMDLLATVAALAPTFGFLGTVTGLIRVFQAIQYAEGAVSPATLASGVWEALVASAVGLAVGIPALLAYNLLVMGIRRRTAALERTGTDFLDLLQAPARAPQPARSPA